MVNLGERRTFDIEDTLTGFKRIFATTKISFSFRGKPQYAIFPKKDKQKNSQNETNRKKGYYDCVFVFLSDEVDPDPLAVGAGGKLFTI